MTRVTHYNQGHLKDWVKQQVTQSFWQDKDSCSMKRAYQNVLCYQKNSLKAQMELSVLWKAPTWVLCQDIFSPTTQVGEQATCMMFLYNPSYLHYEAKALTTMACCHSSGVDFCIYICLGEYYHKCGFEDGKWRIMFYKLCEAFAAWYVQQYQPNIISIYALIRCGH